MPDLRFFQTAFILTSIASSVTKLHILFVEQHDRSAAADALIRADYVAQGNTA